MSKKFENFEQNGHQSAILNLTSLAISPLDSAYPLLVIKNKVSISIGFGVMLQWIRILQNFYNHVNDIKRWPPVSHWIWHHCQYHHLIQHTHKPFLWMINEFFISISFAVMSKNVANVKQNGRQSSILYLRSSVLWPRYLIPYNPFIESKRMSLFLLVFELWSKFVENFEQKWLPVGHFESNIIRNITTRFSIPQNPSIETKTKPLSLSILKLWIKMLKILNKNGRQSAILNWTSSGISPLDSAYPKTPRSKQKRSLYLYWFWS